MKSKFFAILTLIFALCIGSAYADGVNVDSGIQFVSESGDVIHRFPDVANTDYTMYASATVKNESDMQKDLILLVSVYDANYNLKKVMYDDISVPADGEDTGLVTVTIPKGTKESDFVCKASLWDADKGNVAYRSESRFLEFNTDLYGITIDGVSIENYSDEEDVYSVPVSKEDAEIKAYPKTGTTSVEYSSINVPGLSTIKLVSGKEKRQIYIKTYMEDDPFGGVGPVVLVPEDIQNISSSALDGLFYNQLSNSWANVELSNVKDENGIIKVTAKHQGTLAKDSRIATFQPWKRGEGTRENASGSYTMHFGLTVNEVTSPLTLAYKYDAGGTKYLAVLTDNKVFAGGKMDGSNYIEVTAPYEINCFMNVQSGEGYVYVNDKLLYQGGMTNSSGDKKWHEVRISTLEESTDIKFSAIAANGSVYKDDITIEDVINAYINSDESEEDEPVVVIPEGIQNIADYALGGFFYKQINNHWSNITLADEKNENGIITTTATHDGLLAAGSRVATFQPWDKNKPTFSNATGAYTMHFGFTVEEISSPVSLKYRFDGNKDLISFSDNKVVVGGNMNGSTFAEVTVPYTINMFMNVQTCEGYIYVNDKILYQGNMKNSSADVKWTEIRVMNLNEAENFKLVTTAATGSVYDEVITIEEVIEAYMGKDESGDDETDEEEPEEIVPDDVKNIFDYALEGHFYKQIKNDWAEVTLSDATDANGVITTTATKDGTLASGKRVGTFQPWKDLADVGSNAPGEYTMHFGFTVDEITSPIYLEYNFAKNGGGKKTLICLSDNKVVAGNDINGSTFIAVSEPYTVNLFMNTETLEGYIYVDDQLLYQGRMNNSSADKTWNQVRMFSLEESENIRFVTTAATGSVYNDGITIEEVVEAYLGGGASGDEPEDSEDPDDKEDVNVPDYALEGYNKKQIKNDWAEITLSNDTDANGVITTTATKDGTLASGKRVGTFQPWKDLADVGSNATEEYTMHFGFTVEEITSPIYLEYNFAKNGGGKKTLICLSDNKVVAGNDINGSTFVEVSAPYTINIFINIKTLEGYIYVDDQLLYQGRMNNSSADKTWNQVRMFSLGESEDIRFVTTAANGSVYSSDVTIEEVIAYYITQ